MACGNRITWRETRARLREDRRRLREVGGPQGGGPRACTLLDSSYLCVWLYRLAHYCAGRGHGVLARLLGGVNHFLTGADIAPACDFGPGLVVLNPVGVTLQGAAGRNLTVTTVCGTGGATGRGEDVGGGAGLPCLGNDVTLYPYSGVLGPVRIGDGVQVASGCAITKDLPAGTIVEPHPYRVRRGGRRS